MIALAFLLANRSCLLQSLERNACDPGAQASSRTFSDQIAIIAIDVKIPQKQPEHRCQTKADLARAVRACAASAAKEK